MLFWSVFLANPLLALVPAVAFQLAWFARFRRQRGRGTRARVLGALPAVAWTLYAIYEWRMRLWSETLVAPIRLDLLLIVPFMLAVTVVGIAALVRRTAILIDE